MREVLGRLGQLDTPTFLVSPYPWSFRQDH